MQLLFPRNLVPSTHRSTARHCSGVERQLSALRATHACQLRRCCQQNVDAGGLAALGCVMQRSEAVS